MRSRQGGRGPTAPRQHFALSAGYVVMTKIVAECHCAADIEEVAAIVVGL